MIHIRIQNGHKDADNIHTQAKDNKSEDAIDIYTQDKVNESEDTKTKASS